MTSSHGYAPSLALGAWFGNRREELRAIEDAHRTVRSVGRAGDPRRPRGGDQIAHAFIVRLYAEFQGFTRDLHDLAIIAFVRGSQVPPVHRPPIVHAATDGRRLDRGNAGLDAIQKDFRRIGLSSLLAQLAGRNAKHGEDKRAYGELTELRNALAHGNTESVRQLAMRDIRPTLTWGRGVLPSLNRIARALDRSVWEHLRDDYPALDPWGTA